MRNACSWALTNTLETGSLDEVVRRFKPGFDQLLPQFEVLLKGGELARFERTYRDLRAAVHHERLALDLTRLSFARDLLNVMTLSFSLELDSLRVASIYFGLSENIEFAMLQDALDAIRSDDRWERRAATDLAVELFWARRQLCRAIAADGDSRLSAVRLAQSREPRSAEVARLMGELRALPAIGLLPLQVTVRALAALAAGN
jgi:NAD-specific glutamate dehydrogenase